MGIPPYIWVRWVRVTWVFGAGIHLTSPKNSPGAVRSKAQKNEDPQQEAFTVTDLDLPALRKRPYRVNAAAAPKPFNASSTNALSLLLQTEVEGRPSWFPNSPLFFLRRKADNDRLCLLLTSMEFRYSLLCLGLGIFRRMKGTAYTFG
jgi:hypothetical protein